MYSNVSICDFKNQLRQGIELIDIRNSTSYRIGNIPYSKNISKNELMFETSDYLDKSKQYYIYCERGIQSQSLCEYLSSAGYNVVNLVGGYQNYK